MSPAISDIDLLLRTLEPTLNDGVYAYTSLPRGTDLSALRAIATVREAEGLTAIVREEEALAAKLRVLFRAAWITLTVHSDLQAVGLTAAFSRALADAGISCNVIAGAYHDHIFVPVEAAASALRTLKSLQQRALLAAEARPPVETDTAS